MLSKTLQAAAVALALALGGAEAASVGERLRGALALQAAAGEACAPALQPCQVPAGWVKPKIVQPCEKDDSCGGEAEESGEGSEDSGDDGAAEESGAEEGGDEEGGDEEDSGAPADPNMPQVTTKTVSKKGGPTITTTHSRVPLPQGGQQEPAEESSEEAEEDEESSEEAEEESTEEAAPEPEPKKPNKLKINSRVEISIGGKPKGAAA